MLRKRERSGHSRTDFALLKAHGTNIRADLAPCRVRFLPLNSPVSYANLSAQLESAFGAMGITYESMQVCFSIRFACVTVGAQHHRRTVLDFYFFSPCSWLQGGTLVVGDQKGLMDAISIYLSGPRKSTMRLSIGPVTAAHAVVAVAPMTHDSVAAASLADPPR